MMDTTWPHSQHDVFWLERWVQRTVVDYPYILMQKGYGGTRIPYRIALRVRCVIKFQYIHNCVEYIYMVSTLRLQRLVRAEMIKREYPLVPITQSEFAAWMEERGSWHAPIRRTKGASNG